MTAYHVTFDLLVRSADLDAFTDALTEALLDMKAEDVSVGGSLETGEFDVWLTVHAGNFVEAVFQGMSTVHGALDRIRIPFLGWEQDEKELVRGVRAELVAA